MAAPIKCVSCVLAWAPEHSSPVWAIAWCLEGTSSCGPCAALIPFVDLRRDIELSPPPPASIDAYTHKDPQCFPVLFICSHSCASIRLLFGGKLDFTCSASTRGTVRWILIEEMMCWVLLSFPPVLLRHTHAVLVLLLLNTFSHSWTSQKLCNLLLLLSLPKKTKNKTNCNFTTFRVKLLPAEHAENSNGTII